jgi:hypothetical protein
MPQKEERHLPDYRRVVVEAMRRLSDSENRFNEDAASSMRQTCLKDFPEPTFSEIAASDYGLPGDASDKEMAAEFWKEIQVLEQCLEELGCEIGLPEWQQHVSSKAAERMHKVLNRRA